MTSEHQIFGHTTITSEEDTRLMGHKVYTGFPNQACDHTLPVLDFNKYLTPNKSATFTIRVSGESMKDANLSDGDLIIVDRSKKPVSGSIIVAVVNSEFAVKIFHKKDSHIFLLPKNPKYRPIQINPDDDFLVWGVVNFIIYNARIYDRSC